MSTNWGSLMVFLKTFPIQAFQKQFIRNGRMMDQQALAAMFMGLGTAYVAIQIKDVIFGRDRSEKDRAIAAFGYNNITSWVPMITDPVLTILNLNGYRINPYGPNASLVPPVVGQLDNLMRAPGAIPKVLFGDPDYYDMQAFKAIPFAGTYGISRIVDAMATKRDRPHIRGAAKEPPTVPIKPVEELILE